MQHINGKTIILSEKQCKQLKLNENDNFASPDRVDYQSKTYNWDAVNSDTFIVLTDETVLWGSQCGDDNHPDMWFRYATEKYNKETGKNMSWNYSDFDDNDEWHDYVVNLIKEIGLCQGRVFYDIPAITYWNMDFGEELTALGVNLYGNKHNISQMSDIIINNSPKLKNTPKDKIMVQYLDKLVPLVSLDEETSDNEEEISDENASDRLIAQRNIHLADQEAKRNAMGGFLQDRSKHSANKLTNDKGEEMSRAEYNALKRPFSESKNKTFKISHEQFKSILNEVRYIDTINYNSNEQPIKQGEAIRVFHGCDTYEDAIVFAKYGISGMAKHRRKFSFESGMNPHGLFVTTDFSKATHYNNSSNVSVIIEFTAKTNQLDFAVWKFDDNINYYVNPQSFKNKSERDEYRQKYRQSALDSGVPHISNSDDPALANNIFDSHQALFVGNLNPNQIKRFWVKTNKDNHFIPYNRQQFLKMYGNEEVSQHIEDSHHYPSERLYRPNDDFTSFEDMAQRQFKSYCDFVSKGGKNPKALERYAKNGETKIKELVEKYKMMFSEEYIGRYMHEILMHLWPKQIYQIVGEELFRKYFSPYYEERH